MANNKSVVLAGIPAILDTSSHYERFLNHANAIRDQVKNAQEISEAPIVAELQNALDENLAERLYEYAMSTHSGHTGIPIHTVKATFVALKIAKGLNYNAKSLLKLGLVAFLENVGMYRIPDGILSKERELEPDEFQTIRKHPEMSIQLLSGVRERHQWLPKIVMQTHERADGSGYPNGLKGGETSELASIVGLADTYVALTSDRPYRAKHLHSDAVKLITRAKALFPSKILRAFLNEVSMFPIGTYVKLNNDSVGRVISTEENRPLRPNVEILYDGRGRKTERCLVIRLVEEPLLYVREALGVLDGSLDSYPLGQT